MNIQRNTLHAPSNSGFGSRYALSIYDLDTELSRDTETLNKLKAAVAGCSLKETRTIKTWRLSNSERVALAIFETEVFLRLRLFRGNRRFKNWIKNERYFLRRLVAKPASEISPEEIAFLESLADINEGWMMQVIRNVAIINAQND
ncbi:hypothetical protein EDB81DRAFT_888618 [Dactylonectria macrodidyma]|uniref:Uncharacterized protein n=1 Tax=Dactylonectria macrodidyma TaxID=307937 RepID=A0A9P9E2W0_9HYPO|nr:hypothetical protein EDB81DRAFT_888618 [Dactylonectria macrodidyma]